MEGWFSEPWVEHKGYKFGFGAADARGASAAPLNGGGGIFHWRAHVGVHSKMRRPQGL